MEQARHAPTAAPFGSADATSHPRRFAELDDRVVSGHPGVVVALAPLRAHGPLLSHAERRLRASGFSVVGATAGDAPTFSEIAAQLAIPLRTTEPSHVAEAIVRACVARRAVLFLRLPASDTWDALVLAEVARARRVLVVAVATASQTVALEAAEVFELASTVGGAERLRWLSAVAEQAHLELADEELSDLERWWDAARRARPSPSAATLSPDAAAWLHVLSLVGRSVPLTRVPGDVAVALVAAGVAKKMYGARIVRVESEAREVGDDGGTHRRDGAAEHRARAVDLLLADGGDAWDLVRAAELLLAADDGDALGRADALAEQAFSAQLDGRLVRELSERWFRAVAVVGGDAGMRLRRHAAEQALAVGDAHRARRWCESAAMLRDGDPEVGLLLGRALVLLGDLVSARVALQRAADAADGTELRARIAIEQAELAYVSSDFPAAAATVERALALDVTVGTRLAARNVMGKLLLAEARWAEADAHFAEDAMLANVSGERVAELRISINRAIAILERGRLEEAASLLERTLGAANAQREELAAVFALANLGLVAYRQHDYARALSSWEEAVARGQMLYGRVGTAHTLANLADLRLRLGLVDEADHAVRFGRRLLSGGAATARVAHHRRVAAQVALARGRTDVARGEIDAALPEAIASGEQGVVVEVWIVAARIALEDGDLERLAGACAAAEAIATGVDDVAALAVLRAHEARARGKDALELARLALDRARTSGHEDLLVESHALLAAVYRDAGDLELARNHVHQALAVRDGLAARLPAHIAAAYLARKQNLALGRLGAELASADDVGSGPASAAPPRASSSKAREIVGDDPQIRALRAAIRKIARSNSTVLIRGESGTGKELVAEALHVASERARGPLVSVNCAALVETLLLSELFGHEKGAFTGATTRRRGRFELAEGGTLFLDEIGDISLRTQVALLRVLQEKTFERVGGTSPVRVDVRVVCATHRDLKKMVERGEFREDLYYRLRGITVDVPPLRDRLGDVATIACHLLARIAEERGEPPKSLTSDAVALLVRHKWPGNIRELENALRAAALFAERDAVTLDDLVANVDDLRALAATTRRETARPVPVVAAEDDSLDDASEASDTSDGDGDASGALPDAESTATAVAYAAVRHGTSLAEVKRQIERDCIARALTETKGNITRAAALLGMKRPRLSQLVKSYGLAASNEGSS